MMGEGIMDTNETSTPFLVPCRYLRSKEMYYQGQEDDAFASGIHWCQQTSEPFGPDGQPVEKNLCCEGRGCYLR